MTRNPHVYCDAVHQTFLCDRCGATAAFPQFPCAVAAFADASEGFAKLHQNCAPSPVRFVTLDDGSCEWSPEAHREALVGDKWHGRATVIVGADGAWRLCASCAALPRFRKMKTRRDVE